MAPLMQRLTPQHILLLLAAGAVLFIMYEYLHRKTNRLAAFFTGTLSGLAALLLAHFCGDAIGFVPPLTVYTAAVAAVAGVPGVLMLALMQYLKL